MKSVFVLIFMTTSFLGMSQSDTSSYLKDSIIQKKAIYIGNPLSKLLKELQIQITWETDPFSFGTTDTFYTRELRLRFYPMGELLTRVEDHQITPQLTIYFQDTISIPRKLFRKGEILDNSTGWTKLKKNYWGQFIVADITVTGVY